MSAAKQGHTAYDAGSGVRGQLAELPDDAARAKFLRAAVAHAEQQAETLGKQADAMQERADEVTDQWQEKAREAAAIYDAAQAELDRWQHELDDFEGGK